MVTGRLQVTKMGVAGIGYSLDLTLFTAAPALICEGWIVTGCFENGIGYSLDLNR